MSAADTNNNPGAKTGAAGAPKKGDESAHFSPLFRQMTVALGPLILTLCGGMVSGFSAIALPQMKASNSSLAVDDEEASWIASIMVLPMPLGCIVGGLLMESYGRKAAHQIVCLPLAIGWALIASASAIPVLLTGRFLSGICVGSLVPVSSVYISETSEPKYRGFLLAALSLALALGFLIVHAMGIFMHWKVIAASSCVTPCLIGLFMCFVPESAPWLIKKGRPERAAECFYWSRGDAPEAKDELKVMLDNGFKAEAARACGETLRVLASREFLKPFSILVVFFITMEWSGVDAIPFYTITFIEDSVGDGFDAYSATLIIDAIRLVAAGVGCVVTKMWGRRTLVLTSGLGTAASLLALSAFNFASKHHPYLERLSAVPFMCLVLYMFLVTVGLGALCWIITGELFPLSTRSYGSAFANTVAFTLFFSVVKTVPVMFAELGASGTFLVYGSVALVGTIVLGLILPEGKDKTLQEIEDNFIGGGGSKSPS